MCFLAVVLQLARYQRDSDCPNHAKALESVCRLGSGAAGLSSASTCSDAVPAHRHPSRYVISPLYRCLRPGYAMLFVSGPLQRSFVKSSAPICVSHHEARWSCPSLCSTVSIRYNTVYYIHASPFRFVSVVKLARLSAHYECECALLVCALVCDDVCA